MNANAHAPPPFPTVFPAQLCREFHGAGGPARWVRQHSWRIRSGIANSLTTVANTANNDSILNQYVIAGDTIIDHVTTVPSSKFCSAALDQPLQVHVARSAKWWRPFHSAAEARRATAGDVLSQYICQGDTIITEIAPPTHSVWACAIDPTNCDEDVPG